MSKLLDILSGSEEEILAMLSPLYAEVRHWEAELARVRKAKREVLAAMTARGDSDGGWRR